MRESLKGASPPDYLGFSRADGVVTIRIEIILGLAVLPGLWATESHGARLKK